MLIMSIMQIAFGREIFGNSPSPLHCTWPRLESALLLPPISIYLWKHDINN
jgi:hypothetical protein